jgi:hypothetical protein
MAVLTITRLMRKAARPWLKALMPFRRRSGADLRWLCVRTEREEQNADDIEHATQPQNPNPVTMAEDG